MQLLETETVIATESPLNTTLVYKSMRIVWVSILAFFISSDLYGQNEGSVLKKIDFVQLGIFSHSISLPFEASNHIIGLNRSPGITIGAATGIWKEGRKFSTKYYASLSFYHQRELHYGIELNNSILAQYRLFSKLNLEGSLGIAYLHTFEDAPIYKEKDGAYIQVRDWGRAQITTNALIGISVPLSDKINAVANYKFLLQLPFARKGGVLFIPHSRFLLGVRLSIDQK